MHGCTNVNRDHLKAEIEVFIRQVFVRIIESPNSYHDHKLKVRVYSLSRLLCLCLCLSLVYSVSVSVSVSVNHHPSTTHHPPLTTTDHVLYII